MRTCLFITLVLVFPTTLVQADERQVLESTLIALAQSAPGSSTWIPAQEVASRDRVRYQLEMISHAKQPLAKLQAAIPVPENATYISNSAQPAPSLASVDGVKFAAVPLVRVERQIDGTLVQTEIPQSEYRALAWQIAALNPGEATNLSIEVVID